MKLNVIFDAIIALAYFSIPIEVAYFYHSHPTPKLFWVFVLFFSFIMLCGITHAIHALSPFQLPTLHATFKVLCGLVSVVTAVYLVKFVPAALKLPKYTAYLEYEIQERQASEKSLRNKNEESQRLRSCLEAIRHTLQFSDILVETTSSLCNQFDLESCFFVYYHEGANALNSVAAYSNPPSSCMLVKNLRTNHPDAISCFSDICNRTAQTHVLEYREAERLFGSSTAKHYTTKLGSRYAPGKSVACATICLGDSETALLFLSQISDNQHMLAGDLALIRDIANQVEIALTQARSIERDKVLLQELQRKNSELARTQQQAQQAIQAKSKFIAIMSHEMRTPLYVITALAELLMDSSLSSELRDSLSTILASGQMLLSNISDVLDYSKFQQDNFVMDKAPFNIRSCIEKCVGIAAVKAHEVGLEIFYHLREGFPEIVDTDDARLSQVFLNLLSNAVKFTKVGTVNIEGYLERFLTPEEVAELYSTQFAKSDNSISASFNAVAQTLAPVGSSTTGTSSSPPSSASQHPPPLLLPSQSSSSSAYSTSGSLPSPSSLGPTSPSSGGSQSSTSSLSSRNMPTAGTRLALLHFTISDTGLGIRKDQIPRLFEEFTQLDNSATRKYEGTGLGLAICKRIVTLMGGSVWVDSVPGEGSNFHFTIIAKIPPPSLVQPLLFPTTGIKGSLALAITGSTPLQRQLADIAREVGLGLSFSGSTSEALSILEKASILHPNAQQQAASSLAPSQPTTTGRNQFNVILLDASLLKASNAVQKYRALNAIAPTIVIGEVMSLPGMFEELEPAVEVPEEAQLEPDQLYLTPQHPQAAPGRRWLHLPLKYACVYLSLRNAVGSLSDEDYAALHSRGTELGGNWSAVALARGGNDIDARGLVRDLVRSTSNTSNSSTSTSSTTSSNSGLPSPRQVGSFLVAAAAAAAASSHPSSSSNMLLSSPSSSSVHSAPPSTSLTSAHSSNSPSSSDSHLAHSSHSSLPLPTQPNSSKTPQNSFAEHDGVGKAPLPTFGGSAGILPSQVHHHHHHQSHASSALHHAAASMNVGGGGNGLPTLGQLTGQFFDSLSAVTSSAGSSSHSSFFRFSSSNKDSGASSSSSGPSNDASTQKKSSKDATNASSSSGAGSKPAFYEPKGGFKNNTQMASVHVFTASSDGSGDSSDDIDIPGYQVSPPDSQYARAVHASSQAYHPGHVPQYSAINQSRTQSSETGPFVHSSVAAPSSSALPSSSSTSAIQQQYYLAPTTSTASVEQWIVSEDLSVLLVEDNTLCRKVCLKQLHRLGIERVDVAVDGQEALDQACVKDYDLIMMDVMMPGVDGISATKTLRQREAERNSMLQAENEDGTDYQSDDSEAQSSVPSRVAPPRSPPYIIAITASSMLEEGSRDACIGAGMDDVVHKPVNLRALHDALLRFFTAKKIVPQLRSMERNAPPSSPKAERK